MQIIKKFLWSNIYQRSKKEKRISNCLLIIIGSIPAGIAGILFKDKIDTFSENLKILGTAFLITALALFLVRKCQGKKDDYDITYKDAIIIGLMQMIALIPGISRSGAVLVGCLLCGLNKNASLKYTFMLYFPVSVASMGLGLLDLIDAGNIGSLLFPYFIGLLFSLIVTYFSYQWLSNWVKKGKLWKFSIYCLCLGLFVLFYFR